MFHPCACWLEPKILQAVMQLPSVSSGWLAKLARGNVLDGTGEHVDRPLVVCTRSWSSEMSTRFNAATRRGSLQKPTSTSSATLQCTGSFMACVGCASVSRSCEGEWCTRQDVVQPCARGIDNNTHRDAWVSIN